MILDEASGCRFTSWCAVLNGLHFTLESLVGFATEARSSRSSRRIFLFGCTFLFER